MPPVAEANTRTRVVSQSPAAHLKRKRDNGTPAASRPPNNVPTSLQRLLDGRPNVQSQANAPLPLLLPAAAKSTQEPMAGAVAPIKCCACGIDCTTMSARSSWVCNAGAHWTCQLCAPNKICRRHGMSACTPTDSLWFDTLASCNVIKMLCPLGCVGAPIKQTHTVETCPMKHVRSMPVGGVHVRGWKSACEYAAKQGGAWIDCTFVTRGARPFTAHVAAGHGVRWVTLQCELDATGGILASVDVAVASTHARIVPDPSSSPAILQLFRTVWPTVQIAALRR